MLDARRLRWVRLDIDMDWLEATGGRDDDDGTGAFTVVYESRLSAGFGYRSCGWFKDNYIVIDFTARSDDYGPGGGSIACMENSTGSDCCVEICIDAAEALSRIGCRARPQCGHEHEAEPFAVLTVWFPVLSCDGRHAERLVRNMLHGRDRPLLRTEVRLYPPSGEDRGRSSA